MYLGIFILLYLLSRKKNLFLQRGKLIGLFFIFVFGGRFFIEYLKPEQSDLLQDHFLLMGQYLSLPVIVVGIILVFYERILKFFKKKEK
jgi:prolipoprotein diacylglyceryltransferase